MAHVNHCFLYVFRMLLLHENGILEHFKHRHFAKYTTLSECSGSAGASASSLPLTSIWPCFTILACGICLGAATLLIERTYRKCGGKSNPNMPGNTASSQTNHLQGSEQYRDVADDWRDCSLNGLSTDMDK